MNKPTPHPEDCPFCHAPAIKLKAAGEPGTIAGDDRTVCTSCKVEYWNEDKAEFMRRKPGRDAPKVAKSWDDPDVAEARANKDRVTDEAGNEYRSLGSALKALGLPVTTIGRLRMLLKAAGQLEHEGHTFTIVKKPVLESTETI